MPQRNCTKTKVRIVSPNKRITLPLGMEEYQEIVGNHRTYRKWIDELIAQSPELFPKEIVGGYALHDERTSEKMEGVRLRRISLKARDSAGKKQVFTIAPSGVMPSRTRWKRLCSCGVLTFLFGHWRACLGTTKIIGIGWRTTLGVIPLFKRS